MEITKIYYKKLFNTGNYEHEEIGVEVELQEDESYDSAMENARLFVMKNDPNVLKEKAREKASYERALEVLVDKDNQSYSAVVEAKKIVDKFKEEDELPF